MYIMCEVRAWRLLFTFHSRWLVLADLWFGQKSETMEPWIWIAAENVRRPRKWGDRCGRQLWQRTHCVRLTRQKPDLLGRNNGAATATPTLSCGRHHLRSIQWGLECGVFWWPRQPGHELGHTHTPLGAYTDNERGQRLYNTNPGGRTCDYCIIAGWLCSTVWCTNGPTDQR